jgi:lipopolysaccharide/colanic/teichoic acid biosynthesis glycosyltransferase
MYLRESSVDEFGGPRAVPQRMPGPSPRRVAGAGLAVRRAKEPDLSLRRCFDVALALAAIIVFLPLLVLIGVAIKVQDGGPVLFSQERIGKGGLRFRCYKFRSMRPDAEAYLARLLAAQPSLREEWATSRKLKSDPRITLLGDFLRRSSLDELPQLFNILRGDMSLVGPRPIVEAEVENYGRWFGFYLAVRPGLTGLWQVSGRNDVSYRRRVAMDRLYVRTRSVKRYVWIVLATVPAVLYRRGSY